MKQTYTQEQFEIDKAACNAAINSLSAYRIGEARGRLDNYAVDLMNLTTYWEPHELMWEPVVKMMIDLVENDSITGLNCLRYAALLAQVLKKCQSKRVFRRRKAATCLFPKLHAQPCSCAKTAELKKMAGSVEHINFVKPASQTENLKAIEKLALNDGLKELRIA